MIQSSDTTITSVVHGKTVLSNHYTTVTLSPTNTPTANSKSSSLKHGLSKKDRNIVLGCCLGIGIPFVLIILIIIYYLFIRSKPESYIDSDGQIVTTYSDNPLLKFWYTMIGKSPESTTLVSSSQNNNNQSNSNSGSNRNSTIKLGSNINSSSPKHLNGSPFTLHDEFEDDGDYEISITDSNDNNDNEKYMHLDPSTIPPLNNNNNNNNNIPSGSPESSPNNMYSRFIERFDTGSMTDSQSDGDTDDDDRSSHRVLGVTNY